MGEKGDFGVQALVFFLVGAAFTNIYLTQPVLPVLREAFAVSEGIASMTISSVVFGIALANLPLGALADRFPVRPIILFGGLAVAGLDIACALSPGISLLIAARFAQGLFIPTMTTCMAAYLARTLPPEKLSVAMGAYVSATVAGGLGGRLLGGWVHDPANWRHAFFSAAALVLVALAAAHRLLPKEGARGARPADAEGFIDLLLRGEILRIFLAAFGGFFVFSSVFNYLPFYLSAPGIGASTDTITFMYLSYVIGIFVGPLSGRLAGRFGSGRTMVAGAVLFLFSLSATLVPSLWGIMACLCGICAGFFAVHASAAGALNIRVRESRGKANSLYVLFYYLGGFSGISLSATAFAARGWPGVVGLGALVLMLPLGAGIMEIRRGRRAVQA